MSKKIPTTEHLVKENIAILESALNQRTPAHEKAFSRVLATMQAMVQGNLFHLAKESVRQNFAASATGKNLSWLGGEYGVFIEGALTTELLVRVETEEKEGSEVVIAPRMKLVFDDLIFRPTRERGSMVKKNQSTGKLFVEFQIASEMTGSITNLLIGEKLTIQRKVENLSREAVVLRILRKGRDAESEEEFRSRVLARKRLSGYGHTVQHYRMWASRVPTVRRVFPYLGNYEEAPPKKSPPDRTIFVEPIAHLEERIITNGAYMEEFIRSVKHAITYGEDGSLNEPLGLSEETLHVILCRRLFVETVVGLNRSVLKSLSKEKKDALEKSLKKYLESRAPFIEGAAEREEKSIDVAEIYPILNNALGEKIFSLELMGMSNLLAPPTPGDPSIPKAKLKSVHSLKDGEVARFAGVTFREI